MSKYTSLLYREWKLSRRHYLFRGILMIVFIGLLSLIMSFIFGAEDVASESINIVYIFAYFIAGIAAVLAVEDNGVFASDINSDWLSYSYALPISAWDRTVTRYVMKILATVIFMTIAIVGANILCGIAGITLPGNMIMQFFLMLDAFMVYTIAEETILLRARNTESLKKIRSIVGTFAFVVIFVLPEFLPQNKLDTYMQGDFKEPITEVLVLPDVLAMLTIPALFVIFIIGFIVTWKTLESPAVRCQEK